MAIKRRKKTTKRTVAAKAYRQAMLAEGAPTALDIFGLGSPFGVFGPRRRKATVKRRATKKTRAKIKPARARKSSPARPVRRRKTTRRARRA